ncbi:Divalent-cation tolerance protein CutA [Paragonimus heterotremus]|uniref:Divalent-cation tolerance protein CutA n=1 Tax=Paragonimus heterotremus TaxID=100268 RepID=A0A8J4WI09_9TREM|nr:Divalent-cation tolerance protein CutA [Paragonimus heterotremus]
MLQRLVRFQGGILSWIITTPQPLLQKMYTVAYVTCPNSSSADEIASHLVTKKLAACVNIIPAVQSVYIWKGKLEKDNEVLLLIKTRGSLMDNVIEAVKSKHPYECPEIIFVELKHGNADYLKWISDSTLIE